MSAASAAAWWDAHFWWEWSASEPFVVARGAVDKARDEGMPRDQWATMVRVLEAARDEVPPDKDTARSIYITAETWDEPGAPDWMGKGWSDAKDAVGGVVGGTVTGVASTVVPLLWGVIIVGGLWAMAKLKG